MAGIHQLQSNGSVTPIADNTMNKKRVNPAVTRNDSALPRTKTIENIAHPPFEKLNLFFISTIYL